MAEDATQPGSAVALAADEEVPQRNGEAAVGQRNAKSADAPVVVVVRRHHTTAVDMRAWAGAGAPAAAPAAPTQDAGAVARFVQAATGAKRLTSKIASVSPQKVVIVLTGPMIDGKPGFILTRMSKEVDEVSPDGTPLLGSGAVSAVRRRRLKRGSDLGLRRHVAIEHLCAFRCWSSNDESDNEANGAARSSVRRVGRARHVRAYGMGRAPGRRGGRGVARAPRRAVRRAVGPASAAVTAVTATPTATPGAGGGGVSEGGS